MVYEFDVVCILTFEAKAQTPLHAHTNAVLAFPVTLERLEAIGGQPGQGCNARRGVKYLQPFRQLILERPQSNWNASRE